MSDFTQLSARLNSLVAQRDQINAEISTLSNKLISVLNSLNDTGQAVVTASQPSKRGRRRADGTPTMKNLLVNHILLPIYPQKINIAKMVELAEVKRASGEFVSHAQSLTAAVNVAINQLKDEGLVTQPEKIDGKYCYTLTQAAINTKG